MAETIDENAILIVKNVGTEKFVGKYANKTWVISPGEQRMAPYHATCLWFGDPRAIDIQSGKRSTLYRTHEIERLSNKYGLFGDPFYTEEARLTCEENGGRPFIDGRHPNLPRVELYDPQTNARVFSVIEDPEGVGDTIKAAYSNTDLAERDAMKTQLQRLTEQVAVLTGQLANAGPEEAEQAALILQGQGEDLSTLPPPPAPPSEFAADRDAIAAQFRDAEGIGTDITDDPQPDPDSKPIVDRPGRARRQKSTITPTT